MKITSVEPQKKNPKRFNVFLDGKFGFGADEDLIVNRRLVVGKEILKEDLEKIVFEAEVGKLMERMYTLFTIRQRSEKEVRDYLRTLSFKNKLKDKEEVSSLAVEMLIESLKRKQMLDDLEFAKAWVEARSKKKGLQVIKQELFKKGISREIIEEVIGDKGKVIGQNQTAQSLLERKMRVWKNLAPMEFRKKSFDFLLRRGFEYGLVKDLVEEVIKREYNSK